MKIKVVGGSGERLYECADVTVTYYTEPTLAFQDARRAWQERLDGARHVARISSDRLISLQSRAQRSNQEANHARDELSRILTVDSWVDRVRLWLPRTVRRAADLKRRISQAERDARIAEQAVQELLSQVNKLNNTVETIKADEVTPGIEMALRSTGDRRLIKVYLPADGEVAYIMNDAGQTIDVKRWPMKRDVSTAQKESGREAVVQ